MELRIINTFLHIAELRSFSRAARELGYSQSAVSAQIAQLEAELETPLFDRVGKTVRLTDAGQTFLSYARTLLATSEQAKAALQPARQVGGTAGTGDNDLQAIGAGVVRELGHELGRAVRGDDLLVVGDAELVENIAGALHGLPVAGRSHDHCDFGLGFICHYHLLPSY